MRGAAVIPNPNAVMKIKTILIVEDEVMFREFLAGWFRGEGYGSVWEAATLEEAERLAQKGPDLVMLDMDLPDGEGMAFVERQLARRRRARILVLTAHLGSYPVVRLKKSGVMGVLDKAETTGEELRRAVRTLEGWRTYYSDRVERTFRGLIGEGAAYYRRLSPREEDMLKQFGFGLSNEEIAAREGLSVATVQGHRRNVMAKVGVKSTPEMIIWAIQNGFVNGPQIGRFEREG